MCTTCEAITPIKGHYPELLAKPHKNFAEPRQLREPTLPELRRKARTFSNSFQFNKLRQENILESGATFSCLKGYIAGQCGSGHNHLKAVFCGKEYCLECGCDGSYIHQRRIARWVDKVFQFDQLGYFVITVPDNIRKWFDSQEKLSKFRIAVKRKLQELGYDKGLIRFHWFGDCRLCQGEGCNTCQYTGAGTKWNPHLNILVEDKFKYEKRNGKGAKWRAITDELKAFIAKYFKNNCGADPVKANIHYSFAIEDAHKMHKLKYVTRATFKIPDEKTKKLLEGFRTTSTWGTWEKGTKQSTDEVYQLEKGLCPCCIKETGEVQKIKWDVGCWKCEQCFKEYSSEEKKLFAGQCSCSGCMVYCKHILGRSYKPLEGTMQHIAAGYYQIIIDFPDE